MKYKKFQEITVTELCEKADINRSTFYKYYALPQDVMEEYIKEMYGEGILIMTEHYKGDTEQVLFHRFEKMCRLYFNRTLECRDAIANNIQYFSSMQNRYDVAKSYSNISTELRYKGSFFWGGISSVIQNWLFITGDESPEYIATLLTKMSMDFCKQNPEAYVFLGLSAPQSGGDMESL